MYLYNVRSSGSIQLFYRVIQVQVQVQVQVQIQIQIQVHALNKFNQFLEKHLIQDIITFTILQGNTVIIIKLIISLIIIYEF